MPTDESGKPLDVAISSMSVISRTNPAQIFEAALGKIAAKTGKPYVVRDFAPGQNIGQEVENELAKHNVNFKETLTDPITGRQIPNVGVGNMYIMKLHHLSESKAKGRGLGGYDESGQPLRGASGKAMRMSLGDTNALLSAGATKVLHDSHMLRGQANDEFWAAFMAGFPTRPPHESAPFKRFLSELKGAGLNPIHKGTRYHLWAMTDKDVDALAGNRIVKNGETLDISRDGRPIKDGLHDPNIFGTVDSTTQWAKIPLHEPVINPAFEDPIRRLLGLTENKLREVIAGRQEISTGTGMKAIVDALRNYNVPKELEKARADFNSKRKTQRDDAQRKLGYLKHMSETNRSPADWILSSVPVLPPGFRPVSMGGRNNSTIVHDYNYVYKELIEANDVLKELSKQVSDTGDERLNLYDSIKAVTGLGDPVGAKNKERGVKGILSRLLGDTSKMSYLQQRLLGTPVNLSGRGAILPDPELDMDEIGVPKSIAWDIYHPFIVRRLVRSGMPRVEAVKQVTEQTDTAKDALKREMSERPVLANRYPLLHRYGHMAFNPVLVEGDAIRVNHIVTKGFNADFNGDSVLTDLIVVRVNNELFIGNFEQFIQKYVLPDYVEKNAVDRFGKQTTGFEFDESVDIRVPSVNIDGSTSWNKVKQITIHTSHGPDCYMVKTKNGMQSIFTAHHNFLKLSPICEITSAYTSEVSVGDLVPTILGKDFDVINDKYGDQLLDKDYANIIGEYISNGNDIPSWIYNSPYEFRVELLKIVINKIGKNCGNYITLNTSKRNVALGIKMLLATLGVPSSINKCKVKLPKLNDDFKPLVKFSKFKDIVPLPQCIIDILSKRRKKFSNSKYAQQRYCPRSEALLIIKGMKKNELDELCVRNWIGIVSSPNLVWEPITSIEKVDRPDVTYDFSVEGSETFCIDGFYLTHNTFSLHVPLSDEAIKEAYEKMLPSRNLFSPASMKVHYLPNMEHVQALHAASTMDEQNPEVVFETKADMLKAFHEGKIGMGTRIKILKDK